MPRVAHGSSATPEQLRQAHAALASRAAEVELGFAVAAPATLQDFDFLFPELQDDDANLLPRSAATVKRLKELGRTMVDPGAATGDGVVPAIYTYFGQFVDHDITFETSSFTTGMLLAPNLAPLPVARIRDDLKNLRTASLELDSLYGPPAPRDPADHDRMLIGKVTGLNGTAPPLKRPPGKGDDNDLPREPRNADPLRDRAARIGDPRNDENLIVAQLHLAFLKAHNRLVDQGRSFEEARRLVRQHYQHIVLHDFLKRVADPAIVDGVISGGNRFYDALGEPFFLPLEFTVAGFRFGHTMVRDTYDFNLNFDPASLGLLFTFTALSGELGDFDTLPDNWIIQWERFIAPGGGKNKARRFDTKLADGLFQLQTVTGQLEQPADAANLAVRNLLRGYGLRMPTGQALAGRLGLPALTATQLEAAAASTRQAKVLRDAGFLERTPLWYYLLAEARHGGGQRLGPVGGTLVAEVLVGLVRRSEDSILRTPGWVPSLPAATAGRFELADLLRFAKVAGGGAAPRTYKVKKGDSLSLIAQKQLGDAGRWPELFVLNRAKIRHRDRLSVGQVLTLPGPTPIRPRPQLYKVKKGDTLSGIARSRLGDASRWPEIAKLNRDVVADPDEIAPGLVLVIVKG
ncbi:MAG TPA: LysM peptidoglycan-binding domain-containing protein [Actinomycetota bacterium]|nr:LysM peptidoglycan-binding domain-containing protein [Actinomycetota bacterium]